MGEVTERQVSMAPALARCPRHRLSTRTGAIMAPAVKCTEPKCQLMTLARSCVSELCASHLGPSLPHFIPGLDPLLCVCVCVALGDVKIIIRAHINSFVR